MQAIPWHGVGAAACALALSFGLAGCGSNATPAAPIPVDNTVRDSMLNYGSYCPSPQRICIASLYQATLKAANYYKNGGKYNYVLTLDMTSIDLSAQTTDTYRNVAVTTAIDVTGINPPNGVMFSLEGEGMLNTTINVNAALTDVAGTGVSNVNIRDLTFVRPQMTTSQGSIVSMSTPGHVSVLIPPGYVLPDSLYVPDKGNNTNGRFLRAYHYVTTGATPTMNLDQTANNPQLSFGGLGVGPICNATTRVCDITLDDTTDPPPASWTGADVVLGIKSEGTGTQSYYFNNTGLPTGNNVGFTNVGWQDSARGNWRNITGAFVVNGVVKRRDMVSLGYQLQALATAGGGPQIGTPGGTDPDSGAVIDGFSAQNMGDDAIAIFNDTTNTGVIKDTSAPIQIDNDFARTINLDNSCNVQLKFDPSHLTNCSPLEGTNKNDVKGYNGCVTNTTPNQCTMPQNQ